MPWETLEPGVYCWRSPEVSLSLCGELLENARRGEGVVMIIKDARRRKTYAMNLGERQTVLVKQFFERHLWDALKSKVRPRPGRRAWSAACRARELGIPTARPLAYLDDRPHGSEYLALEFLDGWCRLDHALRFLPLSRCSSSERAMRQAMLVAVARSVRKFHDAGVSQPDFIAGNIMVKEDKGEWGVAFVDLDAARFGRGLFLFQRCRALGKLDASLRPFLSATERLFAYKAYAGDDEALLARKTIFKILSVSNRRTK